jgi:AcrR family transcriptional regulator
MATEGHHTGLETRRSPSKGDRREQGLLDAFEALLAQEPLARVSVDAIALRAGVSRTAFYFYFPNKASALAALIERSLGDIWQVPDSWLTGAGDPSRELDGVLKETVRVWVRHGPVLRAAVDLAGSDERFWRVWNAQIEGFISATTARIALDRERGLAPDGPPPRAVAEALCWMIERYLFVALTGEPRRPAEEAFAAIRRLWWSAIYAPPEPGAAV